MAKNKKPNAFFYFMINWKLEEEKRGQKFPKGLKDVKKSHECNKQWRELPEDKKDYYKNKVLEINEMIKKYSITGVFIEEFAKKEFERLKFIDSMKDYLLLKIKKGKTGGYVQKLKYYVIHTNHYYIRTLENESKEYYPAEIAIAEFSLEKGVTKIYHTIVKPKIKTGYASYAQEHCNETHQLPISLDENLGGADNYEIVYKEIRDFLNAGREDGKLPSIYTRFNEDFILNSVTGVLHMLSENEYEKFTIYSLEELLAAYLEDKEANVILDKDLYDNNSSIACDFHKNVLDFPKYCSRASVLRWIYVLRKNCQFLTSICDQDLLFE